MSVTKVKLKNSYLIEEHWTAPSREEIITEYDTVRTNYPSEGYGTSLVNVKQDPTSLLWHAEFSRYSSCD